jgi:hypothetical protein
MNIKTYFDTLPEELIVIIFLKSNNYFSLIKSLQLDQNKYFRHLCIDKYKNIPFSKYPINLELNDRPLNWTRIYENINYIIIDRNDGNNNITENELYMYCDSLSELFLLLLFDFNDFYNNYYIINSSDKIPNFEYTKIIFDKIKELEKFSPLYLPKVLDNFKAYIPIYANNFNIEKGIIPYNNDYIDKDGYIIQGYTEESTTLFLCTHKLVNGKITKISLKESVRLYNKGYGMTPIQM